MKAAVVVHQLRIGLLLCGLLPTTSGQAAVDAFVNFGSAASGDISVVGESVDPQYPGSGGWTQVSASEDGILNHVAIGGASSGASTGKAQFSDLTLRKAVDSASPALFSVCARGLHFDSVQLVLRNAAGVFSTSVLETVFVKSISWSVSVSDGAPSETVVLSVGKWQWTYTPFNSAGQPNSSRTVNWDVIDNTGGLGFLPGLAPTATSPTFARSPGLSLEIQVSDITAGGAVTLNFAGVPGYQYDVQFTSDLGGSWTTVTTVTAPADGLFTFTETPRSTPAFYRMIQR